LTLPRVDVRSPKGPHRPTGEALVAWARQQLQIASEIVDNPGGGLLFAAQTMGQVRVSLLGADHERFAGVAQALLRAEDQAIHRDFAAARVALAEALDTLEPQR
jgi:hypothetical protein